MTSNEAFEQYTRTSDWISNNDDDFDLWQAACAYQKQKDAEIAKDADTMPSGYDYFDGRSDAGRDILNQGDE